MSDENRDRVAARVHREQQGMPRIVGQRALGGQVIGDRAGELAAQPAGVVAARDRQGAVAGPLVGDHLIARGVVGLNEDDAASTAKAGIMPGIRAGRPGEDRAHG